MNPLENQDPEIWEAIQAEAVRQHDGLEMIASENYTSPAIMQAAGSVLTNKYAEGYPRPSVLRRLRARRRRSKTWRSSGPNELFGAEAANVQPHSGSQANMAVYLTVLEPGDTVMGLDLAQGGHLTHGMRLNISGNLYNFVSYGVDETDAPPRFRPNRPDSLVSINRS